MLSYAVYARERQLLRVASTVLDEPLENNEAQLHAWVRNDAWLGSKFEQINVLWCDPRFSLVPKEFASEQQAATLAKHVFATSSSELLRYSDAGINQMLYPVSEKVYYAVRSRFPEANQEHLASRILNWYMDPSMDQDLLVINHGHSIQVLYREGEKLQFCQSFPYSTANEAAYFVLNSLEKLSINRDTATIRTLGIRAEDELFQTLDTYIRKVKGLSIPLPDALKKESSLHPLLISKL